MREWVFPLLVSCVSQTGFLSATPAKPLSTEREEDRRPQSRVLRHAPLSDDLSVKRGESGRLFQGGKLGEYFSESNIS